MRDDDAVALVLAGSRSASRGAVLLPAVYRLWAAARAAKMRAQLPQELDDAVWDVGEVHLDQLRHRECHRHLETAIPFL